MGTPEKKNKLRPARWRPVLSKGSALAKTPWGKLIEAFRYLPVDKIKEWPLLPPLPEQPEGEKRGRPKA